jgi:hypothetical protein
MYMVDVALVVAPTPVGLQATRPHASNCRSPNDTAIVAMSPKSRDNLNYPAPPSRKNVSGASQIARDWPPAWRYLLRRREHPNDGVLAIRLAFKSPAEGERHDYRHHTLGEQQRHQNALETKGERRRNGG